MERSGTCVYVSNIPASKCRLDINPLIATLKPQSNGPSYSNTVIGIHWPLMGGLLHLVQRSRRGLDGPPARPRPSSLYKTGFYLGFHIRGSVNKYQGSFPLHFYPFPIPSPQPFPPFPLPSLRSRLPLYLPSPLFLSLPLPSPSPPLSLPSLIIEVGPWNPAMGLGSAVSFPQRGLGRSPSRNRIWCILALKSDIWWQQF